MDNIIYLLNKYNIRPSKRLGQNFLTDRSALREIIEAADLSPENIILEVGPGLGVLTLELAKKVKRVIAVEKDNLMVGVLKNILIDKNVKNVEVVEGDILKLLTSLNFLKKLQQSDSNFQFLNKFQVSNNRFKNYKLVANIPYYLTSPLIRKFLEAENQPSLIVLLIQKEVAQRICAKPPKMTILSVATQFYAEPKIVSYVSRKSFHPQPKVDSAIIKISPIKRGFTHELSRISDFFKVVKTGFAHPRKQLLNNLSTGLKIERPEMEKIILKAGLTPTARPSELSVDNWVELTWNIYG